MDDRQFIFPFVFLGSDEGPRDVFFPFLKSLFCVSCLWLFFNGAEGLIEYSQPWVFIVFASSQFLPEIEVLLRGVWSDELEGLWIQEGRVESGDFGLFWFATNYHVEWLDSWSLLFDGFKLWRVFSQCGWSFYVFDFASGFIRLEAVNSVGFLSQRREKERPRTGFSVFQRSSGQNESIGALLPLNGRRAFIHFYFVGLSFFFLARNVG